MNLLFTITGDAGPGNSDVKVLPTDHVLARGEYVWEVPPEIEATVALILALGRESDPCLLTLCDAFETTWSAPTKPDVTQLRCCVTQTSEGDCPIIGYVAKVGEADLDTTRTPLWHGNIRFDQGSSGCAKAFFDHKGLFEDMRMLFARLAVEGYKARAKYVQDFPAE